MSLLDRFAILFETDSAEASQEVDELNKKLKDTDKNANDAVDSMDDASDSADEMGFNFAEAAKSAATLIATFVAFDAIKDRITETALLTDTIGKLTQTEGLNIIQMDAWGAAAERNGGSASAFQASVIGLNDQLSEIQFGGGQQIIQTLAMMGVSAFNSNGQIRDTFSLLESLAGVFEGMSARRSASLGRRLGLDQGTILLLQQGRVGVQQLVEQQERLGAATEESYLAAANFNDAQDNLNRTLTSVWQTINTAILPILTDLLDGVRNVIQWMRENEDFTIGFFIAIGTAITAVALPAITSLVGAIAGIAAPFALPIAAIASLATGFALLFEDVKAYIDGNSSLIGDLANKYEWFGTVVDGLIDVFKNLWKGIEQLFDFGQLLVENPKEALVKMKQSFIKVFTDIWDYVKDLFDFDAFLNRWTENFTTMFNIFGDDEDGQRISENTLRAIQISNIYGANPLNTYTPSIAGATNVYNSNNFAFSNSISAKGVTPEQVDRQLTDEFGRQVATAGNMLDDGISY